MANRRMFSKRIIESARFLKLPISSQALYFHLGMHADDDGIVEAYPILKSTSCTEDDLKILVAKNFVQVLNDDLVTYIMDWRENNQIRADRKVDSIYKDLLISFNPSVTLLEARERTDKKHKSKDGQPMDVQWTTNGQPMDGIGQVSSGQVSSGQVSSGQVSSVEYSPYQENTCKSTSVDSPKVADVVNLYHEICKSYPTIRSMSENRKKAINARLRTHSMDEVREVFEKAERSSFLKGSNKRNWSANFDWLMNDANFCKVLDGNYDDKNLNDKKSGLSQEEEDIIGRIGDWY